MAFAILVCEARRSVLVHMLDRTTNATEPAQAEGSDVIVSGGESDEGVNFMNFVRMCAPPKREGLSIASTPPLSGRSTKKRCSKPYN